MILVDTSVWVDHFKNRNEDLARLLVSDLALIHPLIIAGGLRYAASAEHPNPEQPASAKALQSSRFAESGRLYRAGSSIWLGLRAY